jgi:hypothetical protein
VPGVPFPKVKRLELEADRSPPSGAEIKNTWNEPPLSQNFFIAWCLIRRWIRLHGAVNILAQGEPDLKYIK